MGWPNALRSLVYCSVSSRICRGVGEVGDRRAEALLRQELHHVDEAVVELADDVVVGDPDVLEEQLGGVGLVLADLVELAAAGEAVRVRPRRRTA